MKLDRKVAFLEHISTLCLFVIPLLPVLQHSLASNQTSNFQFYLSVAIQWYVVIRANYLTKAGKLTTARIFVFGFHYVSSGLANEMSFLLNYHSGLDYYVDLSQLNKSLLFSFISLIVLDFSLPSSEIKLSVIQIKNISMSVFKFYVFLSTLLLLLYITQTGIPAILSSRESVSENIAGGALASGNIALSGLYVSATKIFPLIVNAFALILRKHFSQNIRRLIYMNSVLLLFINNPISTPRYQFAIFIVVIIFCFDYLGKNRSVTQLFSLILIVVLIFPSLDFARTSERIRPSYSLSKSFEQLALKDFDQVLMGALTLNIIQERSTLFPVGKQILGEVGAFVPRSIWVNKPLDASIPIARYFNLKNENLSVPLWAEGYLSFRYIGVFAFPMMLGLAFRRINVSKNLIASQVFQSFLLGSLFIILRGTLMQYGGLLFAAIVSIILVNKSLSTKSISE